MRNLFNELFTFRVRENFSAKENFLTETFAYFLQRDMKVCHAFVKAVSQYPGDSVPRRMSHDGIGTVRTMVVP